MQSFVKKVIAAMAALVFTSAGCLAAQDPIQVVAAENFYGDIAAQIGGSRVQVLSILRNPDQDPHLFEASPSIARALAHGQLVIYNGAGYDPWMDKLLAATQAPQRKVIKASALLNTRPGANPHLWYDPVTMPAMARAIAHELTALDPAGQATYDGNFAHVSHALEQLQHRIDSLRSQHAGTPVTATEPVFGYMADALGFTMRNQAFQVAVMNDTEPSASQIRAFEDGLKARQVRLLFYNSQQEDSFTQRVKRIAREHDIPIMGVTETMPEGVHFQDWVARQLADINAKLAAWP